MIRIESGFWDALSCVLPSGDEMRVRTPLAEISPRLLAGVDARGRRRLLIALHPEEAPLDDTRSRGLSVQTMELSFGSGNVQRFVIVECNEASGYALFDLIGGELAQRLATELPADAVAHVLASGDVFGANPLSPF